MEIKDFQDWIESLTEEKQSYWFYLANNRDRTGEQSGEMLLAALAISAMEKGIKTEGAKFTIPEAEELLEQFSLNVIMFKLEQDKQLKRKGKSRLTLLNNKCEWSLTTKGNEYVRNMVGLPEPPK